MLAICQHRNQGIKQTAGDNDFLIELLCGNAAREMRLPRELAQPVRDRRRHLGRGDWVAELGTCACRLDRAISGEAHDDAHLPRSDPEPRESS